MEVESYYLRMGTYIITSVMDCSKAFDMCLFIKLFKTLLEKEDPSNCHKSHDLHV